MSAEQKSQVSSLSSFIWSIADELWGDFKHTDFARMIVPLLLLRRLECVLELTSPRTSGKGRIRGLFHRPRALPFYSEFNYKSAQVWKLCKTINR